MRSLIDIDASLPDEYPDQIPPVSSGILTQPVWGDSYLTPGIIPTSTHLGQMTSTALVLPSATVTEQMTQTPTSVATLLPTNTPIPTSTIYYPPPPLPTNTKKSPPAPTNTNTPVPPTPTNTNTSVPPTPTNTNTPVPPTPTNTDTPVPSADLSITKDNGSTSYTPGEAISPYIITVSNSGTSANNVIGATVTDTFDTTILDGSTISWTCTTADAGTSCTASGTGNINDTVNLPIGTSVTYTVNADTLDSATETLTNTAYVIRPAGITDTEPNNNFDSDTPDNVTLPSFCSSIINVNSLGTYTTSSSGVNCLVFTDTSVLVGTGAQITLSYSASLSGLAGWYGLGENGNGVCGNHLEVFASSTQLQDITITRDGGDIIFYLFGPGGDITVDAYQDWDATSCP